MNIYIWIKYNFDTMSFGLGNAIEQVESHGFTLISTDYMTLK